MVPTSLLDIQDADHVVHINMALKLLSMLVIIGARLLGQEMNVTAMNTHDISFGVVLQNKKNFDYSCSLKF